jgi:aminopeptidase 2
MIRTITKVRRLAAHVVNAPFSRISIHKLPTSSPATFRPFCAVVRDPNFETYKIYQQRLPPRQTVRHCSHRRAMCRKNADISGGSVNVEADREVLPTNVKPLHYSLTLEPNFDKFTYEGTVVIEYVR